MRAKFPVFLLIAFFSSRCDDSNQPGLVTPSHLTLEATVSNNGSGLVTFIAHAHDAVRYDYYFGEIAGTPALPSTDGTAVHTYLTSNTYKVTVVAFSADDLFVDKEINVTVQVNEVPISNEGFTSPLTYTCMTLVWQDEFNDTELNPDNWTHEVGNGSGGWGNNELEFYQPANTTLQDGYLFIKAKRESAGGFNYTSSRIITKGKKEFKYGRVDIRAILPKGQGIWPALWMLGANINEPGIGWPKCGEIDIMELIGGTGSGAGRDNKIYGTAHWDNTGSYASYGGNTSLAGGATFADKFHVFSVVWTETAITWYLDDVQFHVIDITPAGLSEFKEKFFVIFNVAVGGNWPGSPDTSTVFPQRMVVDYIRVFQ